MIKVYNVFCTLSLKYNDIVAISFLPGLTFASVHTINFVCFFSSDVFWYLGQVFHLNISATYETLYCLILYFHLDSYIYTCIREYCLQFNLIIFPNQQKNVKKSKQIKSNISRNFSRKLVIIPIKSYYSFQRKTYYSVCIVIFYHFLVK